VLAELADLDRYVAPPVQRGGGGDGTEACRWCGLALLSATRQSVDRADQTIREDENDGDQRDAD